MDKSHLIEEHAEHRADRDRAGQWDLKIDECDDDRENHGELDELHSLSPFSRRLDAAVRAPVLLFYKMGDETQHQQFTCS